MPIISTLSNGLLGGLGKFSKASVIASVINTKASYQYWRLLATNTSWIDPYGTAPYFHAVREYRFYESIDCSGPNLSTGGIAISNQTLGGTFDTSKAADEDVSTYWQNVGAEGSNLVVHWGINFGAGITKAISSVQMFAFDASSGYHAKSYAFQYSSDGTAWTTLNNITTVQAVQTQSFNNLQ